MTRHIVRAGVIAALYAAISIFLAPISFPAVQFRAAEALTLLPILFPEAVFGVTLGCLISNIYGGLGIYDIVGGTFATFLAAVATYYWRRSWIAYASPIVINALVVSSYLAVIAGLPYWLTAASIALGEAGVVIVLGIPLIRWLSRVMRQ
ncbi:MAG: QueT transporter family protein [Bacillota bacterium]